LEAYSVEGSAAEPVAMQILAVFRESWIVGIGAL